MSDLVERFLKGDRLALGRLISLVENGTDEGSRAYDALYGRVGGAFRVGVTGPPGAGKSTLVRELAVRLRQDDHRVGIVAVDPTSPISGGALLGDRIRMPGFAADRGIFMRSMATRGSLGGLAATTAEVTELMDAFGHDYIFVETVGVGQAELDVIRVCHSIVVTLVPESGDAIQVMKAGLLEIGHVFVVNKADRAGADSFARDLREALELRTARGPWKEPVLTTVARTGQGVDEVAQALSEHRRFLGEAGKLEEYRRRAARERITALVDSRRRRVFWDTAGREERLRELTETVVKGDVSPRGAAKILLEEE